MSENRLLRLGIALAVVGVASAMLRYVLPYDLHVRVTEPLFGSYSTDQLTVLRAHPFYEHSHRLGGVAWMILGLFQVTAASRGRRGVHRWIGRIFVALSLVAGLSGAAMGALFPYAPGERAPSVLFGAWMVYTAVRGWLHARRREIPAHRAWMTRCLAVGLGVSTIRLMAVALTVGTDIPTRDIVTPVFWAGWVTTVVGAELWLRARAERPGFVPAKGAHST